jgi:hypothetical protein
VHGFGIRNGEPTLQLPAVSIEQASDDKMVSRGKADGKRRENEDEISTQ